MIKREGSGFYLPAAAFLLAALLICLLYSRETIHIVMNRWHTPFLDLLFRGWSILGEGWVLVLLSLLILLVRIRISLVMLSAYILSGLSAQLLKRLVFKEMPRPYKYFELHGIGYDLHLVDKVELHMWNSFPSGHAAAAFGVFFGLSLFLRSRVLQSLLFILALGVAWSRVYLSQHFLMDVAGGALLGLAGGAGGWKWIGRYKNSWLDRSVIEQFRR